VIFKILGEAAATIKPREGGFDNPTSRRKLKPFGLIGAFDDVDLKVRQDFGRSGPDIRRQQRAFVKTGTSQTRSTGARRHPDLECRRDAPQHAAAGLAYRRGYGASCL
jgi:hypothetical protein